MSENRDNTKESEKVAGSELLPPLHQQVLELILKALAGVDIPWALTGSTAFAIQGVSVTPEDIDIQTSPDGAYVVERLLPGEPLQPVAERVSERIRSHFGAVLVRELRVEIMGGIQKRLPGGEWEPPVDVGALRVSVLWHGYQVPVLPLEYEYNAYLRLGRSDRARLLKEFMDSFGRRS